MEQMGEAGWLFVQHPGSNSLWTVRFCVITEDCQGQSLQNRYILWQAYGIFFYKYHKSNQKIEKIQGHFKIIQEESELPESRRHPGEGQQATCRYYDIKEHARRRHYEWEVWRVFQIVPGRPVKRKWDSNVSILLRFLLCLQTDRIRNKEYWILPNLFFFFRACLG